MAPSHRNVALMCSLGAVAAGLLGATLWYQQTAADKRRAMETRVRQLFDECDEVLVEWIVHESGRISFSAAPGEITRRLRDVVLAADLAPTRIEETRAVPACGSGTPDIVFFLNGKRIGYLSTCSDMQLVWDYRKNEDFSLCGRYEHATWARMVERLDRVIQDRHRPSPQR